MLIMAFDVLLSIFVKQIGIFRFFQYQVTKTSFFLLCVFMCTFYENLIIAHHGE